MAFCSALRRYLSHEIVVTIDTHNGLITALATIAIAWFTLSLKLATDRLWDAGERQLKLLADSSATQSRDMQDSIRLAREQFENTFRARVAILGVTIQRQIDPSKIMFSFTLENSGVLPASRILVSTDSAITPDWHPPTRDSLYVAPQMDAIGIILAGKATDTHYGSWPEFSSDNYEAAKRGGMYLRLGIVISYMDGIGGPAGLGHERTTWKWFEWNPDKDFFGECGARQD